MLMHTSTIQGCGCSTHHDPATDARDSVFFLHGIFDTALGWVANGVTGSQAFAAYDAGLDVWLGTSRSNPPRTHIDPRHGGGRYYNFSVNELAMFDVGAQVDAIDACKQRELFAAQLRGAVLALTPEAGPPAGKFDRGQQKQRDDVGGTSPHGWRVGSAPENVGALTARAASVDGGADGEGGTSSHPLSDVGDDWHSPTASPSAGTRTKQQGAAHPLPSSTSSPDSWHECEPNGNWQLPAGLRPTVVLPMDDAEAADVMVPDLYAQDGRHLDPEQEAGACKRGERLALSWLACIY